MKELSTTTVYMFLAVMATLVHMIQISGILWDEVSNPPSLIISNCLLLDKHNAFAARFGEYRKENNISRCALLFFGVARSFRDLAMLSIRKNILEANPTCDIYIHTTDIPYLTNTRNGEYRARIHANDVRLLSPKAVVLIEKEDEFMGLYNLSFYRSLFPWARDWVYPTSMDNMIKQWHGIQKVWELMEGSKKEYDRVGLFRLDVKFMKPIYIMNHTSAVVPTWKEMGEVNDRMFYGDYELGRVWATKRFTSVQEYVRSHNNQLHSESFLYWLLKKYNVPAKCIDACFNRVRANGKIKRDCKT